MMTHVDKIVELGELIATIYDEAVQYSENPQEAKRLGPMAVAHVLRQARRASPPKSKPEAGNRASEA